MAKPAKPKAAKVQEAARNRAGADWRLYAVVAAAIVAIAIVLQMLFTQPAAPAETPPTRRVSESVQSAETGACDDVHHMCEAWHKAGRCANKGHVCRKSCGRCKGVRGRNPPVPQTSRCQRDNHTAAVPAFQLNAIFKRTLEDYPQYSPEILSNDPWVVKYNNFISEAEARRAPSLLRSPPWHSLPVPPGPPCRRPCGPRAAPPSAGGGVPGGVQAKF
eukprot:4688424-Prymnesium_polylepis.1